MSSEPLTMTELTPALAGLLSYAAGEVLRRVAKARGWSKSEKQRIPRLALVIGAVGGGAIGAAMNGHSAQGIFLGALSGWAAVGWHESTARTRAPAERVTTIGEPTPAGEPTTTGDPEQPTSPG